MDSSKMTIGSVDEDIMMMSTNTYVVGRPFDSYNTLDGSLLSELDMSNHNSVNTSMVLDHPLMDINLLPIIGDEELETPIYIPNRTMSSTLAAANQQQKPDATKQNASVCSHLNGSSNPVPKFTPVPKKPTKTQLIYERLKESLERDKNMPRKEVRSKVSESLKAFAAPKDPKTINRETSALKSRALAGSSQVKMRPPTIVTRPTSMTQVPATKKSGASPIRPTATRPISIQLKSRPDGKASGSKPQTPCRPPTSKSANALNQEVQTAEKKLQEMENSLAILKKHAKYNGDGFSVMTALFSHLNKSLHQKTYDLSCAFDEVLSTGRANDELKEIINKQIEQNSKNMEEMNKNFDLVLKEKSEDYESRIEFLKEKYEHQLGVLERQLEEEKERHKIVPVSLRCGEPNVCKGDCNDEIRSLEMTIQLKNEEIHALRGETRELELKNEALFMENKHIGALNAQLERMNQYVRQARENEKLMTIDLANLQNELIDFKRKNVDLQQRLDIFNYKMGGGDGEMIASTHSNSSTRSIHDTVLPGDRVTPDRPHSNSEMTMSTVIWSSVMRRTKPKISQDEFFDERGKIDFNESIGSMAESTEEGVHYASSESSKENTATNDL